MHKFLYSLAVTIYGSAILLVLVLIGLVLSPGGNTGDGGIIAIPFIFALAISTPIGFITALAYLIAKRPSGKSIFLPLAVLVMPVLIFTSIFAYGSFKQRQGVISANEAILLFKQCEARQLTGDNHKRWKISFYDEGHPDAWISDKDHAQVSAEQYKSRSYCKNYY